MTLLIQISDTHILPPGKVLYGEIDTALHLQETVQNINRMRPTPDAVIFTGDLVEKGDKASYENFIELIEPLTMPAWVIPGNHDNPQSMRKIFAGTGYFPVAEPGHQYAIEDFPFRILALNSHSDGTELPEFNEQKLTWLQDQLGRSKKPVLIAIHHPPMTTGIELIDMGGSDWFQGIKSVLAEHSQVKLVICGHCHIDLCGRIGQVPVYMAPANSHQLIATRGLKMAPSTVNKAGVATLHHFIDGEFLSGSQPWPDNVEDQRIDRKSGISWEKLKEKMMGSRAA
jgi:3',5'-cyclic AMP phosphodiesterase CpdA